MSRKIILIKQELLLLVYELNRSGLLAENEKIRPILAQLEKLLLCDLRSEERFSRNAETELVCRLLLEKKKRTEIATCYGWQNMCSEKTEWVSGTRIRTCDGSTA